MATRSAGIGHSEKKKTNPWIQMYTQRRSISNQVMWYDRFAQLYSPSVPQLAKNANWHEKETQIIWGKLVNYFSKIDWPSDTKWHEFMSHMVPLARIDTKWHGTWGGGDVPKKATPVTRVDTKWHEFMSHMVSVWHELTRNDTELGEGGCPKKKPHRWHELTRNDTNSCLIWFRWHELTRNDTELGEVGQPLKATPVTHATRNVHEFISYIVDTKIHETERTGGSVGGGWGGVYKKVTR